MAEIGLKQRIEAAASITEVRALLGTGKNYTEAHPATRRKWDRAARERIAELRGK